MEFDLKDAIYIATIVGSTVASYFLSRHRLRDEFNTKIDVLKEKNSAQDLELEKLRSKDDLQGQVIDQIKGQMDLILVQLFEALKEKGGKK